MPRSCSVDSRGQPPGNVSIVRAELFRPESPDRVVALATWSEAGADLEILDGSADGLDRLLRKTPVVVPGGFPKQIGRQGDTVEQPGSPEWFRTALLTRAGSVGLGVRFVEDDLTNGWDPAANYRTFDQQERRLASDRED
jgi:hypothetical protein